MRRVLMELRLSLATQRHHSPFLILLCFALVALSHSSTTSSQLADPSDPSSWNITSCAVTNLTFTTQTINLTLNIADVQLLYLALPASNTSASLYALNPYNPLFVNVSISAAPVSIYAFLALYSSATNASDLSYLNNTVITAGAVTATAAFNFSLVLYLQPSTIFTLYYLLQGNTTDDTPLYAGPFALPATSNLTVPAGCVSPPPLTYCINLSPVALYASTLDPYDIDASAQSQYSTDLALYSPSLDCGAQVPGVALCGNCLAIRQRWRCALAFAGCSGGGVVGGGYGGPCQWLCREKNSRCGETEDCSVYPTVNCNAATSLVAAPFWFASTVFASLLLWLT